MLSLYAFIRRKNITNMLFTSLNFYNVTHSFEGNYYLKCCFFPVDNPVKQIEHELCTTMKNQKFASRSGTVDFGKSYEFLLAAYYALNLSLDKNVKDFKLSTNNKDLGNFDDVVLEIKFANGDCFLYALQLKHGTKKDLIKRDSFTAKTSDFSLYKYCKGFKDVKKLCEKTNIYDIPFDKFRFILFTNHYLPKFHRHDQNHKKIDSDDMKLNSEVSIYRYDKCIAGGSLNLSECESYFIFKFRNDQKESMDEDFLNQFVLYTQQNNVPEVECLISKFISSIFNNCDPIVITNYMNFFKFWWRGDFGNVKLTKSDVMSKLAEYVLTPFIPKISFKTVKDFGENSQILNKCFSDFDISIVRNVEKLTEDIIWGAISSSIKIPISAQGENFIDHTLPKMYLILWHMDKVPLVIKVGVNNKKDIYAAVKLCKNSDKKKKFILLDESFEDDEFSEDIKIFKCLEDLDKCDLYRSFFENISISLQGRKFIKLGDFLKTNSKFYEIITVKELILMVNQDFIIGVDFDTNFLEHYVKRKIPKILLDSKVIDENQNDLFVISCQGPQSVFLKTPYFEINRYLTLKKNDNQFPEKFVILVDGICTGQQFAEVCQLNKNKNCHHVKIIGKNRLEWLESQGSIDYLKHYQITPENYATSDFVDDSELLSYFENQINILCAPPGMGKSIIMKLLRNNCPLNRWVVSISLKDHVKFFQEDHEFHEVFNYLLNNETKNSFDKEVEEVFVANKSLLFLWDGFDELPKKCLESVISTIKLLSKEGYFQWISSRTSSKEMLENSFGSFSLTITPFSEEDQQKYIYSNLEKKYDDKSSLEETLIKLNNHVTSSLRCGYFDYSGVPLQIYMLVEIFLRNPENIKFLILTDIYHEFIEGKFLELFQKAKANLNNPLMQKIQKSLKNPQMTQYEIAAMKASFNEETFASLNVDCKQFLQTIEANKDNLDLIVGLNEEKKPIFSHKTFEEYLTASWLAKNYRSFPNIIQMLFEEDYKNIRLMFDMILAKDSPIHVAVLYRNLKILEENCDEISKCKDEAGRSPLHIACSWGMTHVPINHIQNDAGTTIIWTNETSDSVVDPNVDIIKFILSHGCEPYQKDDLLNLTSIDYCNITFSLSSIETILSFQYDIKLSKLSNFDTYTFLYYCIKFNYHHLFFRLDKYPYIEMKEGEDTRTLLQFAVHMDRTDFVEKLLNFEHYQNVANKPYKDIGGPLFSAASNGNLKMFKMLQAAGAKLSSNQLSPLVVAVAMGFKDFCQKLLDEEKMDPNQYHLDDNSLLQVAALRNHVDIIQLLLERGADPHHVNCFDMTALNFCIDNCSVEGVRLLLRYEAEVNRQENQLYGYTSLHSACEKGNLEIVKLLVAAGADPSIKSKQLYTPLHVALINKHEEVAKYLIELNPDVINEYSQEKSTPTMLAALENFYGTIELLAKFNADLDSMKSTDSPLRIATLKNFEESVSVLLKKGASTNKPDAHGFTPLFYAIKNITILKMLLDNPETDVNAKSKRSVTPLHFAVENGQLHAVEEMIKYDADVNAADINNKTPMHYAIISKNEDILRCLLKCDAKLNDHFSLLCLACTCDAPGCLLTLLTVIDPIVTNHDGQTALHHAAMNSLYCVKILVKKNVDVNVCDRNNCSPLCFAIYSGKIDIIVELIESGADINIGFGTFTALHLAARLGDVATLILVLGMGCEVNAQDESKRTPLHCVVEPPDSSFRKNFGFMNMSDRDTKGCAKELLDNGATITAKNNIGWTPLLSAVYHNNLEMVKFFAQYFKSNDDLIDEWQRCLVGAAMKNYLEILQYLHENSLGDVNSKDEAFKMTPLGYACVGEAYDTALYLINNGADINAKSVDGCTPLYISSANGNFDLVKLLVENKAEIDIANDHGNTPLFAASSQGFLEVVRFLHTNGANVDVIDLDGDTPLHDAAAKGHVEVVQFLISGGANVDKKNQNGKTPADLARDNAHEEVVKIFEQCK